jgi:predicted GIY-YIG superfamily endonuclease
LVKKKSARRDTYLYHLKQGKKIKRTGITNNPERREREHRSAGKRFSHIYVHPYPMSRETALEREKKYKR